ITLQTKTGAHYGGVVMSTGSEGDTTGATLKDIKDIDHQQSVASTAIDEWSSGSATVACVPDIFLADTDISAKKNSGTGLAFGPGASGNTSWDQFAAHEKSFG
ncbi:hypothetical protein GGG16DRAFT_30288, partial [Schizophyllum commune]